MQSEIREIERRKGNAREFNEKGLLKIKLINQDFLGESQPKIPIGNRDSFFPNLNVHYSQSLGPH